MKPLNSTPRESPQPSDDTTLSGTVAPRSPRRPKPSHIFTIIPNVDTESLLCHACETLASLNVMSSELADELEGPHRNVALAIQQLAALGELLVNRALDIQIPRERLPETPSTHP